MAKLEAGIIIASFIIAVILLKWMIPKLRAAGIVGRDMNKPGKPEVPEMGGFAVLLSLILTISGVLTLNSFGFIALESPTPFLAVMLSILFIAIVGIMDDLLSLPQQVKALLPMIGAVPLIALKIAGETAVNVPFVGIVDFNIFYFIFIIPLSITVSANLTNMLAGFNGLEFGMALPTYATVFVLGSILGKPIIVVFSAAMIGASAAFLIFNARGKVFPGDVGNLLIGGLLAAIIIAGNLEVFGLVFAIYLIEFVIKAINKFPSSGRGLGIYKNGKLVAKKVESLPQLVMKASGGISERNLVLLFVLAQFTVSLAIASILILR